MTDTKHDDGGPAFPFSGHCVGDPIQRGMTLRDYFAAKVLQGMYADPGWDDKSMMSCAMSAYEQADVMLKERAK